MDPLYRPLFNRAYTPELYRRYHATLNDKLGPIPFQMAETPLFFTPELRDLLARQASEIVTQLQDPGTLSVLRRNIPAHYDAPGMDVLPNCVQVDFALSPGPEGKLVGKVVELQAFPSLYAMMMFFADAWREVFQTEPGLAKPWTCLIQHSREEGLRIMRETILGGEAPEHVALLDFEPDQQKTAPDFNATRALFGVCTVDATQVIKQGRALFRKDGDRLIPIRRIYNRMVFDELEVKGYELPFKFTDELDVTWASHPNWYWVWSKACLPLLEHPAVPRARLLSELDAAPADLADYVLKPLFSFAGSGVVIDVTPEDLARVPKEQRDRWVLQEKITYAPAIKGPGGVEIKAEVRVMLLRPPAATKLEPLIHLVRLSRGKMLGVDQNRGMDWVGASVGLWPEL